MSDKVLLDDNKRTRDVKEKCGIKSNDAKPAPLLFGNDASAEEIFAATKAESRR